MVLEPNLMQSRNSLGCPGRGTLTVPRDCLIYGFRVKHMRLSDSE